MNIIPETNGSVLLHAVFRDGRFHAEETPIIAWACDASDCCDPTSLIAVPMAAGYGFNSDTIVVKFANGIVHDIGGDEFFDSPQHWLDLTAPKPVIE